MITRDYLIIGAGIGGLSACEAIREYDTKGTVTLVCAENELPYRRWELSKDYLVQGNNLTTPLAFHPPAWYEKNRIEMRTGTFVTALNLERRIAVLQTGQTIEFRKCCLATGSRALRPAVAGSTLGNVIYLRSLRDANALREMACSEKEAVVVGGGLLAIEVACSLRELGLEVRLLCRERSLLSNLADPRTSEWMETLLRDRGIELLLGESLNGFEGKTVLRNVQTKSGLRLQTALAVVAVGSEMNLELIRNTPLASPNGTPVNELMETDEKGIFAVGDIALFPDKVFGGVRRLTHYECAREQGLLAGANMTGKKRQRFLYVPNFTTRLFGNEIRFVGDLARPALLLEVTGEIEKNKFTVERRIGDKSIAAIYVNRRPADAEPFVTALLKNAAK